MIRIKNLESGSIKMFHRSPKKEGFIQLSSGFYKNGELYPCYDIQLKDFDDLTREGYESGFYDVIV